MAVQYAESGGLALAYEELSESGPPTILSPPLGNRAVATSVPAFYRFYERLARFTRFVIYDRRGMGMSDSSATPASLADQAADLDAIRAAMGVEHVAVMSSSIGNYVALAYALDYPQRVSALVLLNGACCDALDPEGPLGEPPLLPWDLLESLTGANFDGAVRAWFDQAMPNMDEAQKAQQMQYYKASVSPRELYAHMRFARGLDLRDRLREIRTPALVLASARDNYNSAGHGQYMARHLPYARYVEMDTDSYLPWTQAETLGVLLRTTEEFLTGRVQHSAPRVFATVLFTDIVDSTAQQQARGDAEWQMVRKGFEDATRHLVEQHGGRVIQFLGDGAMASFPMPSNALLAAERLVQAARDQGFQIRAGVHAGEAEAHGEELSGICVNIAARVAARAAPGEVLTTATVRDLVEGAGFALSDAGDANLKGIGSRRLMRLAVH